MPKIERELVMMEALAGLGYELIETDHPDILALDESEFQIEDPIV